MNNIHLENSLISVDIVDLLQDYTSLQLDMDSTKVKAAAIISQRVDIARIIGNDNLERVKEPETDADDELRELVIPARCYYTYARSLRMFNGTLTDSGYVVSEDAQNSAKIAEKDAEETYSVAEIYMKDVIDFINKENESSGEESIDESVMTPKIRVFGGNEYYGR